MRTAPRLTWLVLACLLLAGCGDATPARPTQSDGAATPASPPDRASALRACAEDPFGCVEIAAGEPIVIGTALTLTGPDAALGLDAQYGAQVALNFRGDVLGHAVTLLNEDDRCSVDGGTAAANLLRAAANVVAVIGTSCSEAALPAGQLLSEDGILLVSPSATDPNLTADESRSPFFVRTAPNDLAQAGEMARFVCEELAIGTAATVHDGSTLAIQLESAFTDAFESKCRGSVTERAAIGGGRDLDAALASIARSSDGGPPELLYLPMADEAGGLLARHAHETPGLEDVVLAGIRTGLDGRLDPGFMRRAGGAADGMYLSGTDPAVDGDFYQTAFLEEYGNVSGVDAPISTVHAQAFDAANLVLDAMARVAVEVDGVLHVPRSALRDAVLGMRDYEALGGVLTCGPVGDCADADVAIWQVDGDTTQRVWP
jgi:branched-chain amino acid transport system substrate-binding protein